MNKKGQVTIYIIIAIVIGVLGVGIYSFVSGEENTNSLESGPIKHYVENCLEKESKETILEIAKRGGYFLTQKYSTETEIPIYYNGQEDLMPSLEKIEKEMNQFLAQKLFFCTKNFKDFENYEITQNEISIKTKIHLDQVDFEVKYPIKIKKGKSISYLRDLNVEVESNFGLIYQAIVNYLNLSKSEVCLSCLLEATTKYDLYVDLFDGEDGATIYIFKETDNIPKEEEGGLRYVFATQN